MEKGFPTMNQAVATSPVPSTRHRLATGLHLIGDSYIGVEFGDGLLGYCCHCCFLPLTTR